MTTLECPQLQKDRWPFCGPSWLLFIGKISYSKLEESLIEAINNMKSERNLMNNDLVRVHIKEDEWTDGWTYEGIEWTGQNNRATFVGRALKIGFT